MGSRRFTISVDGVAYIKNADGTIMSGDAIDRLAAYEDTGLEPEEAAANTQMFAAYRHVCGGLPPEKISELIEAEQKRQEGCADCKSGFYMTNNVQHPQYKWCPKCGRDLKGERHQ